MAITTKAYVSFLSGLLVNQQNLLTDTQKIALVTAAYTPDYATDSSFDIDVDAYEVADQGNLTGYATGGKELDQSSAPAVNGVVFINAQPVQWDALTGTFRYAVIYQVTNSLLIGCIDFGENKTYNEEPFQLSFPDGLLSISAA